MGLRKDDLDAVLPDISRARILVHRGFSSIHEMASQGGAKVAQSKRFLKRLMKATSRHGQEVSRSCHYDFQSRLTRVAPHQDPQIENNSISSRTGEGKGDTGSVLASASLPQVHSENLPAAGRPEAVDLFSDPALRFDSVDWFMNTDNALSSWMGNEDANFGDVDTPANGDAVGHLLQTSFESWTAI